MKEMQTPLFIEIVVNKNGKGNFCSLSMGSMNILILLATFQENGTYMRNLEGKLEVGVHCKLNSMRIFPLLVRPLM